MKYFSKLNLYKASNVTFDPSKVVAYSYGWWRFVAMINGKLVFNSYGYSNTTRRHQAKVRAVLRELGITVDFFIEAPKGLQDLPAAVAWYKLQSEHLIAQTKKPRTHKNKNAERLIAAKNCLKTAKLIEKELMK